MEKRKCGFGQKEDKSIEKEANRMRTLTKLIVVASIFGTVFFGSHVFARIVILHAIEPIPAYAEVYTDITDDLKRRQKEETIEEIKRSLQEFCKKAEAQMGPPCVDLVTKILVSRGHPPEEILNAADQEGCDMIVLGTHGKGFLAHTFLGSVSSAVLHRTRKPVFIIPLPSEKASIEWDGI